MTYRFGDVLLVPCLFTDSSTFKRRPAIVISSDSHNQRYENIILIAVTSQSDAVSGADGLVISSWERAGLQSASIVKPVIKTFPTSVSFKKIGSLLFADKQTLREFIGKLMG